MWRPESVYDSSGHLDEGVVHGWLDGALAEESAREVEAHAASCATCAARVAEARGLIAGAGRVLGALDAGALDAGASPGITTPAERPITSDIAAARRPQAGRWTMRRISLAAAAVFVFAAGAVVLRDELGDGRGVREAIIGERAEDAASLAVPERTSAPASDLEAGDSNADGAPAAESAPAPAPAPAPPPRLEAASVPAAPATPSGADPSTRGIPSAGLDLARVAAAPATAVEPPRPAVSPGATPAPSAQVGNVAAAEAAVRTEPRTAGRRFGAAAPAPRAAETARSADRPAAEAAVATAAPGATRGAQSALAPQRVEDSLYNLPPQWRFPDAWMLGCWRVGESDTLLLFDRRGLMTRVYTATGDWHAAIRIPDDRRSGVQWRRDGDSTGPVRIRRWERSSDLLLWPGRDSLEAALVPPEDLEPLALTEQQRIDREARRRLRSAAHERRLMLVRQDARRCTP